MELGRQDFTLADLARVARTAEPVTLGDAARLRMLASRAVVERIAAGDKAAYGINTGFGALAELRIPDAQLKELQRRLILSHAVGVGEPLSREETRALLVLRALVLAGGAAGVRPQVAERLLELHRLEILPLVPEKGSVGASGDLAPLAHVALAIIGEGDVLVGGRVQPAREALAEARLTPIVLEAKEGLALVNGTQAMSAVGGLAVHDGLILADWADVCGALTVEGLLGSHRPFDARISALRPHPGQVEVAARLRGLLSGGELEAAHADCDRVQDAYSLRCMPQVHGASRDALGYARRVIEIELNSATDNPLVFAEAGEVISGGNFHGQPLALALDFAAIAVAELASISERRIEQLVDAALSGLPAFLSPSPGQNSGFMMAQVTAASLVNENKVFCTPASVDTIPTSANREDHVSMGMTSARKLREVVKNTRWVLAIELLCAAQALDFRAPLRPGPLLGEVYDRLRRVVPRLDDDRLISVDIAQAAALLRDSLPPTPSEATTPTAASL